MLVSVITPTHDRPKALQLCARWMHAQTYAGEVEWIIVDDGADEDPIPSFERQSWTVHHVKRPASAPGVFSFTQNLLAGAAMAAGDLVVFAEDDDHYACWHLWDLVHRLERADMAGHELQRYYHLPSAQWVEQLNRGASLCCTGFRRELLPWFEDTVRTCQRKETYGVDGRFWNNAALRRRFRADLYREGVPVVGMKGLEGTPGLGVGHRPDGRLEWKPDAGGLKLREWVGLDAMFYDIQGAALW